MQGLGQIGNSISPLVTQGNPAFTIAKGIGLVADLDRIAGVDLVGGDSQLGASGGAGTLGRNDSLQLGLGVIDILIANLLVDVDGGSVLHFDLEVVSGFVGELVYRAVDRLSLVCGYGQIKALVDADLVFAQSAFAIPGHKGEGLAVDGQGVAYLYRIGGQFNIHTGAGAVHLAHSLLHIDGVVVNRACFSEISGGGCNDNTGTNGIVDGSRLGLVDHLVKSCCSARTSFLSNILKLDLGAVSGHLEDRAAHIDNLVCCGKAGTGIVRIITSGTTGNDSGSNIFGRHFGVLGGSVYGDGCAANRNGKCLAGILGSQLQVGKVDLEGGVDLGGAGGPRMERSIGSTGRAIGGQGQLVGKVSAFHSGLSAGITNLKGIAVQSHGAIQQTCTVEVGRLGNSVNFVQQGIDLILESVAFCIGVSTVSRLGSQFYHTVKHIMYFVQVAFSGLDKGNAVLRVGGSGFKTGDLGLHLLADGQTGGVITGAVDSETRRQFFQRLRNCAVVHAQLPVSVERHCVSSYDHSHDNTSMWPCFP